MLTAFWVPKRKKTTCKIKCGPKDDMTSVSGVTHREQKVMLQLASHTPHYTTVYTSLVCILMALKVRF